MKFGCIIKSLAFAIVLIGIGYYIFQKYKTELYEAGSQKVEQFIDDKIDSELAEFKNQISIDSLKHAVKKKFESYDFDKFREEFPKFFDKLKNEITNGVDYKKIKDNLRIDEKSTEK